METCTVNKVCASAYILVRIYGGIRIVYTIFTG
jgi:hypothetical protein